MFVPTPTSHAGHFHGLQVSSRGGAQQCRRVDVEDGAPTNGWDQQELFGASPVGHAMLCVLRR